MLAQAEIEVTRKIATFLTAPPARVLLVDDRDENLLALEAILSPLEQTLVKARSGIDALRHLLTEDFACILMDVQMPDMDGFETVTLIKSREKCRHIPVIFITALSKDIKYVYRGYSTGAVDYISKPINPEILRSKVGVFVELFNKEKELQRQAELLNESIRREAEQKQQHRERELEQQHLRELATTLEARVVERTRELMETNRDLESFCYSIAHDLRTPVREIVATSNLLLSDAADKLDEDALENLKCQAGAARRMGHLIDDLLRLSRLGRNGIARAPVDLSSLAHEICQKWAGQLGTRKHKFDIQPGISAVADPGLLEILLQNLVENALKYSPKGGRVRFGISERHGPYTYFVSDEGIGFDMRYERKVFLPFERLSHDPAIPGTGIGLAMVQKIVSKHGGRVWAEAEPGKGATFYFSLGPHVEEATEPQMVPVGA